MKKLITLFALMIVSCKDPVKNNNFGGQATKPDASIDVVVENKCSNLYDYKTFEVTTDCGWECLENDRYDFVTIEKQSKTLLTINSEDFYSTPEHFTLSKIRQLRNQNVNIDDIDETTIDNVKFAFINADKGDIESWHFFGMKNNNGYSISCGGPQNSISKDKCQEIFNTIKIK